MDLDPWIQLVFQTISPAVLVALFADRAARRDIRMASRVQATSEGRRYWFAVFNAEERAVREELEVRLEPRIAVAGGRFCAKPLVLCGDTPHVRAGWEKPKQDGDLDPQPLPNASAFVVRASEMRPFTTWMIVCDTAGGEGGVDMTVRVGGKEPRPVKASPMLAVVVSLLSAVTYLLIAVPSSPAFTDRSIDNLDAWRDALRMFDYLMVAMLLICSGISYTALVHRVSRPLLGFTPWMPRRREPGP
jgi:hypothetical protein